MAEHSEKAEHNMTDEEEEQQAKHRSDVDWSAVKDQFVGILAGVVRWVGLIFALLLVLHIIFVIADANPDNGIVTFVRGWAESLTLGFRDLFRPEDENLQVLVNYGIAAVFWLVVSSVGASLIRKIGGAIK